jgi:glycosyltransferase involved in cell wall biosynthesis
MRITLVGPAHPWRGGVPLLTMDLAHRLSTAGERVQLYTWTSQGPARLLPAEAHPLATPEAPIFPAVRATLSWRNPWTWWRTGSTVSRESDVVVLVFYTTLQSPALWAVGAQASRRGARVVAVCCNVVPHETRPGEHRLFRLLMRSVDAVLVHTEKQREALAELTDRPAAVAALPPHLPVGDRQPPTRRSDLPTRRRLLFFGKVRHYKGVDLLLAALTRIEDVELMIVGELYQNPAELQTLITQLGLTDRVTLSPEYLPADRIASLFADVDAIVLPYRKSTGSQLVALAQWHGLPVVATRVGNFPDTVRDGVDGLLCEPDDVEDLIRALRCLYEPGRLAALRDAVRPAETEDVWADYLKTLYTLLGVTTRRNPAVPASTRWSRR